MESACQAQATTRKFAHQLMSAKAKRGRVRHAGIAARSCCGSGLSKALAKKLGVE